MSRLYVSNVSSKGKIEELRSLFEECGKIKSFGVKEGAGYMEYETAEEAENAIKKLNGKEFYEQNIIVEPSRKTFPRSNKQMSRSYRSKPRRYRSSSDKRGSSSSSSRHGKKKYYSRHDSRSRSRSDARRSHHHRKHHSRHSRSSRSD